MPLFLARFLATGVVRKAWAFFKDNWKLLAIVAASVVFFLAIRWAIGAYHDSLANAYQQGVTAERNTGQVRTSDAIAKVEVKRSENTSAIAAAATETRKAQAPAREASQARSRRDEKLIATAPQDPMVSAGGPLDRMFGDAK